MTDDDALFAEQAKCPERPGDSHCDHWWDGLPCCGCGSDEGAVDGPGEEGST